MPTGFKSASIAFLRIPAKRCRNDEASGGNSILLTCTERLIDTPICEVLFPGNLTF